MVKVTFLIKLPVDITVILNHLHSKKCLYENKVYM